MRISGTSSFKPGSVENSCWTPSILTAVTAAPGRDERSTRRSAFPSVTPKPRSRGSIVNFPYRFVAVFSSASTFFGICRFFHFIVVIPSLRPGLLPARAPSGPRPHSRLGLLRVKLDDELLGDLGRYVSACRVFQ